MFNLYDHNVLQQKKKSFKALGLNGGANIERKHIHTHINTQIQPNLGNA